jgi:hypothetical protein
MQIEECFRTLDVSPTSSGDEIRKAYRTLVSVWHPDRFVGNPSLRTEAERKLASINEAFDTLEAAGFPHSNLGHQSAQAASDSTLPSEPISRQVQRTIWGTSVVVLAFLFWLASEDKSLVERAVGTAFAALVAGSAFSTMVFHLVWSVKARPRTWVISIGASAIVAAWLLDKDPSLTPVVLLVGSLGGLLSIFLLFYARSRPTQSLQTQIWNRLVGFGFAVMLFVAAILVFFSLPTWAIAVSCLYWFGWTWLSWMIAGRLALHQARR